MRVQFRDNLGSSDAASLGVDFRQCTRGAEIDVPDDVAQRLIEKRFAVESAITEPPVKLKGVKKPDLQSEPTDKSMEPEAVPKGVKKTSE